MTDTPEQTRKCSNCMWWIADCNAWGECRGGPPTPRFAPQEVGQWPWTMQNDWCGSFRMKEPGQ